MAVSLLARYRIDASRSIKMMTRSGMRVVDGIGKVLIVKIYQQVKTSDIGSKEAL
jgi:hypothetical protein